MENFEKDVIIFQHKIKIAEMLREQFNDMMEMPYGHEREKTLIYIMQNCEEAGIRTDLIFCSRPVFEEEKANARI